MPYTLRTKEIDLCGEMLTVSEASNAMDIERTFLISQARVDGAVPEEMDALGQYTFYVTSLLYPSLIACTTGKVPTVDEFLYSIPTEASSRWTDVARELNPKWFAFLVGEEDIEKKEESPIVSTEDSLT